MKISSTTELLDCAVHAARTASAHAWAERHRRQEVQQHAAHDVKLVLDHECQMKAAAVIHARFPDHSILGEEASHDRDASRPRWIVDPIDGTVNFAHGWPLWCTSVAVEHEGRTLAGVICAPALDECYTATCDQPALLNGLPIAVSTVDRLAEALIMTDTNKEPQDFDAGTRLYGRFLHQARKARVMGSAALDICRVACGQGEGYTALGIYPWDTAAAALIVEQAGGRFEIIEQLDDLRFRAIASNGHLHDEIRTVFLSVLAEGPAQAGGRKQGGSAR